MTTHELAASTEILTVFRSRLRQSATTSYRDAAAEMLGLAEAMPGFIDAKTFVADDQERVTIVRFKDRESHNAWRDHPLHRVTQGRGVTEFYSEYQLHVAAITSSATWSLDEHRD
ncbi:MAG: antibiotic biosynthesis monooxygenase [Actinomycetota bacterium]|jgi:heme-degrading monooxygenase HmoA